MNKTSLLDGVQTTLSYAFKSPRWQSKIAIGAALSFANHVIPILPGILLTGYSAKIMRNMIEEDAEPSLPEWDDWGNLFILGFKVFAAAFVYMLPAIVFLIIGYIFMMFPAFLSPFLISSDSASNESLSLTFVVIEMIGLFAGMFLFGIGFLLYIPLGFILPPALAHVAAKDSFAAAFRIKEWWAILRANLGGFVAALVVVSGIYLVVILIVEVFYFTIILCVLMPIALSISIAYISVVAAAAVADAYRVGAQNLAAANA